MIKLTNDKNLINLSKTFKKKDRNKNKEINIKSKNNVVQFNKGSGKSFRMISKIETQKTKGRYNIYINNEFAFGVDEEVLIKFELRKGTHISSELQEKIENEDTYYKAYQRTLKYLNHSLRSKKQIIDFLIKNEIDHFTERIIEQLEESNLLDDLNYAESYIRTASTINQTGPENIRQELYQRGISDNDINLALDEYPYELQLENAIGLAEKRWKRTRNDSEFEAIQKVKYFLVGKGYSFSIADEAMDAIDTDKNIEEEYDALVKQADKALRRYKRKHEGYELTQRLQAYLYSKAYPRELINRYIDERELK